MRPPALPPEELEELAARWAVRHAEGLEPPARIELERWLKADPRHYAAFAEAELALSLLRPVGDVRERAALRQEVARCDNERRRQRRRGFGLASAGLAAAAALWIALSPLAWHWSATPTAASATPTVAVRPLVQLLPDGTAVELNAGADLAVEFTPQVRGVRLLRGEAHFAVAKEGARPFVVSVGAIGIRAVGTAFNVRVESAAVQVLVTEGQVAVETPGPEEDQGGVRTAADSAARPSPAKGPTPAVAEVRAPAVFTSNPAWTSRREGRVPLLLPAGFRTVVGLGPPAAPVPIAAAVSPDEIRRELAWRRMRLELSNATLEEAVALYNRHGRVQFAVGDAELRTRRLSGIFRADQPAQFAELIEAALNLRVIPDGPDRIVLRQP